MCACAMETVKKYVTEFVLIKNYNKVGECKSSCLLKVMTLNPDDTELLCISLILLTDVFKYYVANVANGMYSSLYIERTLRCCYDYDDDDGDDDDDYYYY